MRTALTIVPDAASGSKKSYKLADDDNDDDDDNDSDDDDKDGDYDDYDKSTSWLMTTPQMGYEGDDEVEKKGDLAKKQYFMATPATRYPRQ